MEDVKQLVPDGLRRMISKSTPDDLIDTCTSLLEHLLPSHSFQQVLQELGNPEMGHRRKNADAATQHKTKGNQHFSTGYYAKALASYSEALRLAPLDCAGADNNLVAIIYVNRAYSMHKLELFEECIHDCGRAIAISPYYAKAWYRRGMARASLKHFEDAIQDLEMALGMQDSIAGKQHIKEDLERVSIFSKHILRSSNSKTHENIKKTVSQGLIGNELCTSELECVSTEEKGRGMLSSSNIYPSAIVHSEEPLAAVVLKSCRESHCSFCFNELPADTIFCLFCATPSYCSEHCREQAGSEHMHECLGVNWPVVLPPAAVLVGRIMANFMTLGDSFVNSKTTEILDFAHNYIHQSPERKFEIHIYSLVLLHCLNGYFGLKFPLTGTSASQLVMLFTQVRVNSMAIVYLQSYEHGPVKDVIHHCSTGRDYTCNMKQVQVAQAIYQKARLFNHSCHPNIHAYFISRKLFIRSTKFVSAGCPLELSYGPQIGEMDHSDRQRLLEDQYSFKCQCMGCSVINLSDIIIHAFCCSKNNCFGAVLEVDVKYGLMTEDSCTPDHCSVGKLEFPLPVSKKKRHAIKEVASILLDTPKTHCQLRRNYCLSCGHYRDSMVLRLIAENAVADIQVLRNAITLGNIEMVLISDALLALKRLRSVRHAYSKDVAQAEDIIAEAYCMIGDFKSAIHHCKASVEVLKKIYGKRHIVMANELVKLASIQLYLEDRESATRNVEQVEVILSLYYGSHASKLFPYWDDMRRKLSE